MFSYITRTLKALLLMNGPLFLTGFRKQIEEKHPLSQEEKIWLSEQYRQVTSYDEFMQLLCGTNTISGQRRSNYLPYWQTVNIDGEDDSIAATNQYKTYLQSVIQNHGPLSYIDKISTTLALLGLEPYFYSESEVTSWDR